MSKSKDSSRATLKPEERAFVDAFWGTKWTIPQAEAALAQLLTHTRRETIEECITLANTGDECFAECRRPEEHHTECIVTKLRALLSSSQTGDYDG